MSFLRVKMRAPESASQLVPACRRDARFSPNWPSCARETMCCQTRCDCFGRQKCVSDEIVLNKPRWRQAQNSDKQKKFRFSGDGDSTTDPRCKPDGPQNEISDHRRWDFQVDPAADQNGHRWAKTGRTGPGGARYPPKPSFFRRRAVFCFC